VVGRLLEIVINTELTDQEGLAVVVGRNVGIEAKCHLKCTRLDTTTARIWLGVAVLLVQISKRLARCFVCENMLPLRLE